MGSGPDPDFEQCPDCQTKGLACFLGGFLQFSQQQVVAVEPTSFVQLSEGLCSGSKRLGPEARGSGLRNGTWGSLRTGRWVDDLPGYTLVALPTMLMEVLFREL